MTKVLTDPDAAPSPMAFSIPAAALVAGITISVVTLPLLKESPDMTAVRHWSEPAECDRPPAQTPDRSSSS